MREQSEDGGLGEDGEVGRPGETKNAEAEVKLPIDGDGAEHDQGSANHGRAGISGGEEGASVEALRGPEGEREGEDGEEDGGGVGVGSGEGTAAQEEIDDGLGEREEGGCGEQ